MFCRVMLSEICDSGVSGSLDACVTETRAEPGTRDYGRGSAFLLSCPCSGRVGLDLARTVTVGSRFSVQQRLHSSLPTCGRAELHVPGPGAAGAERESAERGAQVGWFPSQSLLLPGLCESSYLPAIFSLSFLLLRPARLVCTPGPLLMVYPVTGSQFSCSLARFLSSFKPFSSYG